MSAQPIFSSAPRCGGYNRGAYNRGVGYHDVDTTNIDCAWISAYCSGESPSVEILNAMPADWQYQTEE
jgi:hypothetical protein